jgi:uncharacterized protein YgfB (UPF0149 family)
MLTNAAKFPEYQLVEKKLINVDSELTAAECHGLISALLLSENHVPALEIISRNPEKMSGDEQFMTIFRQLVELTARAYRNDDFDFPLLLPNDDQPLAQRSTALSDWCGGFVMGLLETGLRDFAALPGDAAEVANDIVSISQMDSSGDEGGSESDLMQLQEYVRVGVQIIYDNLHDQGQAKNN